MREVSFCEETHFSFLYPSHIRPISLIRPISPISLIRLIKKRLSNKFGQSLFIVSTGKKNKLKNKAFMLKFSVKAFVMS